MSITGMIALVMLFFIFYMFYKFDDKISFAVGVIALIAFVLIKLCASYLN
jgi:hypothetical protein